MNDLIPPDIKLCRSVMAGKYVRNLIWQPVSVTSRALLLSELDSDINDKTQITDRGLLDLSDQFFTGN